MNIVRACAASFVVNACVLGRLRRCLLAGPLSVRVDCLSGCARFLLIPALAGVACWHSMFGKQCLRSSLMRVTTTTMQRPCNHNLHVDLS